MQARAKLTASITIVAMALGFIVALQYHQMEGNGELMRGVSGADTEQTKLQTQLTAITKANQQAEQQLAKITAEVSNYEARSAGSDEGLQDLQKRLEAERILAGVTPVTGPGVEVVLMDGTTLSGNTEQVLTHDWDVRQVINELFTAGAEAVSINGYRVVATSAVTCVGPVVKVNDHRLGAPFTIDAIGDPKALSSALTIQGGILDALRARGVNASQPVEKQNIQMPAFTGVLTTSSGTLGD
ncbi:DUF881 domain-containing protein [Alicyclobacillus cycloheptanicus]|uniref:Uncharacterized protein YlxW (UPF0749 family) n=1 Tax=Alicyclobacillus cycloheptanicus TaxID=1457 RepID=A0ABT9XKZ1_9BACL|nr:DUF881 domain-containing protein [Alicyclobacillus cycloheptanicus]MDQ0190974.1 uncharacterized protein YlxW (UPF0749 family) [Alicyclobacillus cycloheptanicus]WDM01496.1 DUF881 domain-containing protein [Alicyclobacillus cycloheptanicus]